MTNFSKKKIISQKSTSVQNSFDLFIVSGNQTTTSSSASNITELVTPTLVANKRYRISGFIKLGCNNTGGVKLQITIPSGATVDVEVMGRSNSATAFLGQGILLSAALTTSAFCTANSSLMVLVNGEVSIGATPGVIQFGFASGVNTQTSTIYQTGTQIVVTRIN